MKGKVKKMNLNIEEIIKQTIDERIGEIITNNNVYMESDNTVYTAQEAVDFFGGGISYGTLMRECRQGNIPCFHIGNRVYFRRSSLIKWIEDQEQKSFMSEK